MKGPAGLMQVDVPIRYRYSAMVRFKNPPLSSLVQLGEERGQRSEQACDSCSFVFSAGLVVRSKARLIQVEEG